jgi:hypothetical protein
VLFSHCWGRRRLLRQGTLTHSRIDLHGTATQVQPQRSNHCTLMPQLARHGTPTPSLARRAPRRYNLSVPITGLYSFNTCGSGFDTYVRVFNQIAAGTRSDVNFFSGSQVAGCDDCGPCGLRAFPLPQWPPLFANSGTFANIAHTPDVRMHHLLLISQVVQRVLCILCAARLSSLVRLHHTAGCSCTLSCLQTRTRDMQGTVLSRVCETLKSASH